MPGRASTSRSASSAVANPIGTLTKKIHGQEIASVSTPPASSPIDPPAAATNPYTPIAFACSPGSRPPPVCEKATPESPPRCVRAVWRGRADQSGLSPRVSHHSSP